MNRRGFLKALFSWLKKATLVWLFPFSGASGLAGAMEKKNMIDIGRQGISLREMAAKKIHHGDGRFVNPFSRASHGRILRVISWKLFHENRFKSHYDKEPTIPLLVDWKPVKTADGLSITFLKHSTVMIKDRDRYILVDPVFFDLFWFIKDFTPLAFDLNEMPRPHHTLITHGHYDHLDKTSLISMGKNTHVISPLGYSKILGELGMQKKTELDWFHVFKEGEMEITLLPCNHWSMRNPFTGPNRSLWGSYLIKTASGPTIFISGDTAYFDGFREIGKEYSVDLAIFNLGAYEPRWFMTHSHMNPDETVRAFRELGARHLMIVHWGTFRLGDEPVHFPPLDIRRELANEGLLDHLLHLDHGQTLQYTDPGKPAVLNSRKARNP